MRINKITTLIEQFETALMFNNKIKYSALELMMLRKYFYDATIEQKKFIIGIMKSNNTDKSKNLLDYINSLMNENERKKADKEERKIYILNEMECIIERMNMLKEELKVLNEG